MSNLAIAFPDKSNEERKKIAKKFYRYFTDTFLESVKFISISKKQLLKRVTGSFDLINSLIDEGKNVNRNPDFKISSSLQSLYSRLTPNSQPPTPN